MSILQDIKVFIQGNIAAGFTAEVYQEYGINAKQVTDFARLMIRAAGVYESHDVAGMQVSFIGHAANNVQVFMLDGEAVGTYEWLERAAKFLDVQFSKSLGIEPRSNTTDADFIDELLRDELRCGCGEELHYEDDDTLSRCNSCDPDRETNKHRAHDRPRVARL